MKEFKYFMAKVRFKVSRNNKEIIANYFRNAGMQIGRDTNICCNIMTMEPFLIKIGNNVTISGDVKFVTHDNSVSKLDIGSPDIFGRIVIGDNCFIGQNSIVMYGVELASNIIVASGSVVCNSFTEERIIIGGNPARKIGTWDEFKEKCKNFAIRRTEAEKMLKDGNYKCFIRRKPKQ